MPLIACQSVVIWPGLLAIGWHLKRRWLNDGRILAVLGIISYLIAVSILVSYPIARMSLPIVPLLLVLIAGAGWELSLRRGCEMEHLAKHD
jgi:peptidoglycan/LPS O-acetylase OafA/YrhL